MDRTQRQTAVAIRENGFVYFRRLFFLSFIYFALAAAKSTTNVSIRIAPMTNRHVMNVDSL